MPKIDEMIAQSLRDRQLSGELLSAKGWGRPLDLGDGYEQTPPELRMAFRALKDDGYVPPEVEAMKQIAALRAQIESTTDAAQTDALKRRVSELQQHIALRLEKLRVTGSL